MRTGHTCAWRAQVRQATEADHLIAEEDVLIKSAAKSLPPAGRHNQQNTAGLYETLYQINRAAFPVHEYLPDRLGSAEIMCRRSAKGCASFAGLAGAPKGTPNSGQHHSRCTGVSDTRAHRCTPPARLQSQKICRALAMQELQSVLA